MLSGCGNSHHFCKSCICSWLERHSSCPNCQAALSLHSLRLPPREVSLEVYSVRVICTCGEWEGAFGSLPAHLACCSAIRSPCRLVGGRGERGVTEAASLCRFRRYGCAAEGSEKWLLEHERNDAGAHLGLVCHKLAKGEERERKMRADLESLRNTVRYGVLRY